MWNFPSLMSEPIRILIVDDHLPLRIGLAAMLSSRPHLRVVGEAQNNPGAVVSCEVHRPDVVLMDLRIPDGGGVDATLVIRRRWPATRVLIVTTYDGDEEIHRALQAGASGYLLKGLSTAELVEAVEAIHAGRTVIPPALAERFRQRISRKDLSPRELEVLQLIVSGRSNKEIATELGVGDESVKSHSKSLFHKLGVADRTQAAIEAIRHGIVRID
jgi:DNA-binding NarL/FixJ family response regulator